MATDPWGIVDGFEDALGEWRDVPEPTRAALRQRMDADPEWRSPPEAPLRFVRPGSSRRLHRPATLVLEDGTELTVDSELPRDLPFGYHRLLRDGEDEIRCVVSPRRSVVPRSRSWGFGLQLYALRSRASWGMGDLGDLAALARWASRELGARLLLTNPLGAALPGLPQEPSPYSPSSRRFLNPLYLRIESVPGAREAGVDLEELAAAGRQLNEEPILDRDRIYSLKMEALARIWKRIRPGDAAFEKWRSSRGDSLSYFATFCALAERFGSGWTRWPESYRRFDAPAVSRFANENSDRVRFHEWIQFLLDAQLAKAASSLSLVQDLAIGVAPGGADAWVWQDVLARDVTVGAPPDEYNTLGQDWGLPPFIPWKLRQAGYSPFIETLRAVLSRAGGLRIDHVMGLFRLYWIPGDSGPSAGGYVRYPADELLDIVAIESRRRGAPVVGEDLGTVEEGVREKLAQRGILSYRLLWFEEDEPETWPRLAMASVTTHDLPTVAGLWTGADLEEQHRNELPPNEDGMENIRRRLIAMGGLTEDSSASEAIRAAYSLLARSPALALLASLEDALAVQERPNLPGANDRPNWSLPLPERLEELTENALVRDIGARLRAATSSR